MHKLKSLMTSKGKDKNVDNDIATDNHILSNMSYEEIAVYVDTKARSITNIDIIIDGIVYRLKQYCLQVSLSTWFSDFQHYLLVVGGSKTLRCDSSDMMNKTI